MACNLSQYCAGNIAGEKNFSWDICRGNIFIGTIAAAKQFASINTDDCRSKKQNFVDG